jgi:rhamnosyltransferase
MANVGVVIVTLNAESFLRPLLTGLKSQTIPHEVLIIDSSSTDATHAIANEFGHKLHVIKRSEFNHGLTRELGRKLSNKPIVVFLTQDALPANDHLLENLIKPLDKAALSYARQLPYPGAGFFEAFHREYNYPEQSQLRSIQDQSKYGAYTFFCSDSCAAYRQDKLDLIGGFKDVLLGEDTLACASLLHQGEKIAYVADAQVFHSHNYTLSEEFKRSFDIGFARAKLKDLIGGRNSDEKRGRAYAKELFIRILKRPWLIPYTTALLTTKWLGYQLGYRGENMPLKWKLRFCSHKGYFKSKALPL